MRREGGPRPALVISLFLLVVLAAVALRVPRWWEERLYRQAEALTGVGARVLPGSVTESRRAIEAGNSGQRVVAAIGRPSFAVGTEGLSRHDIWTYYYADGTMTVNLTDGVVARVSLSYGPPKIPTTRRP